jgi:hypothetical protein
LELGYDVSVCSKKNISQYDVIIYSKFYNKEAIEEASQLKRLGKIVIFDICDNHFYNPKNLPEWNDKRIQLSEMISLADHVVTSTHKLSEVIREECNYKKTIHVIGDGIESDNSFKKNNFKLVDNFNSRRLIKKINTENKYPLIWFGNHGSPYADGAMMDLLNIQTTLETVNKKHPLSLTVISNSKEKYEKHIQPFNLTTYYIDWKKHTFIELLRAHKVVVIPVTKNPFTECKTNNRVVTAFINGLAVVADDIPSYLEFKNFSMLANWQKGLEEYITNEALRLSHVKQGSVYVKDHYSFPLIAKSWEKVFSQLSNT